MKFNKKVNHKELWLDSMVGMSWGFFSTLIIGTIIGLIGEYNGKDPDVFTSIKLALTFITSFAIGVGVGIKAKLSPLQIIALGIVALLAAQSMIIVKYQNSEFIFNDIKINIKTSGSGDVLAAWLSSVILLYIFKMFTWNSLFDIFIIPLLGVLVGLINFLYLAYITSFISSSLNWIISKSINDKLSLAILLSPIIGMIMGLALSLPISSAAIAFSLSLSGNAGIAALAGTSAQMITFGTITYLGTKSWPQALSVAFGTSMLQMKNYTKKPTLLIIPLISSGLTALIATIAFAPNQLIDYADNSVTTGMGTSALYGQIYTFIENSWTNIYAWINVIVIHLIIPIIIGTFWWFILSREEFIKGEWLQLWENTAQDISKKQN